MAGFFVFKQPSGQAWLSMDKFMPNTQVLFQKITAAANKLSEVFENNTTEKNSAVKVYRWKDSSGNWNYSDKPKATIKSEEVLYDTKNIVVLPKFKTSTINSPDSNIEKKSTNTIPSSLITSPNKALDLYKDAKNVQNIMNGRQDKLSKAIQNSTK